MNDKQQNDPLTDKAKSLFDESVDGIDGATRSRLNQGRQAALAELASPTTVRWQQWVPATGVAAAAVIAVALWNAQPQIEADTSLSVNDFELLMNEDSFDMLQDLEFYSFIDIDAEMMIDDADANVG